MHRLTGCESCGEAKLIVERPLTAGWNGTHARVRALWGWKGEDQKAKISLSYIGSLKLAQAT